jgi:hypothetical protein
MSQSSASGSAVGYDLFKRLIILIVKITIFLVSVNNMVDMFYLGEYTCHTLLVSTILIHMMIWLNKHIYDVMLFLITSFLWIKLNMNLPKFLTVMAPVACVFLAAFPFLT